MGGIPPGDVTTRRYPVVGGVSGGVSPLGTSLPGDIRKWGWSRRVCAPGSLLEKYILLLNKTYIFAKKSFLSFSSAQSFSLTTAMAECVRYSGRRAGGRPKGHPPASVVVCSLRCLWSATLLEWGRASACSTASPTPYPSAVALLGGVRWVKKCGGSILLEPKRQQ